MRRLTIHSLLFGELWRSGLRSMREETHWLIRWSRNFNFTVWSHNVCVVTITYVLSDSERFASVQRDSPVDGIRRPHNNLLWRLDARRFWRRLDYLFSDQRRLWLVDLGRWTWTDTGQRCAVLVAVFSCNISNTMRKS